MLSPFHHLFQGVLHGVDTQAHPLRRQELPRLLQRTHLVGVLAARVADNVVLPAGRLHYPHSRAQAFFRPESSRGSRPPPPWRAAQGGEPPHDDGRVHRRAPRTGRPRAADTSAYSLSARSLPFAFRCSDHAVISRPSSVTTVASPTWCGAVGAAHGPAQRLAKPPGASGSPSRSRII